MATLPAQPTPVAAARPAPTPMMPRPEFVVTAFNWTADQEGLRQGFNALSSNVYGNAVITFNNAREAAEAAISASQSRTAVEEAAQDVRDALDAIQSGPVVSVNGRSGVVVGLQEALVQRTSTAADNGLPLVVGSEYALSAGSAYNRPLPAGIAGSQIVLNSAGGWASSLFTLGRSSAGHTINGVADNVVFDTGLARRIICSCTAPGAWVLAIS